MLIAMNECSLRYRDKGNLDKITYFVHISCMATKTITLELDAYERLRASKLPGESFSAVVRRAAFPHEAPTGQELLDWSNRVGRRASETYLDAVEVAADQDTLPDDPWS